MSCELTFISSDKGISDSLKNGYGLVYVYLNPLSFGAIPIPAYYIMFTNGVAIINANNAVGVTYPGYLLDSYCQTKALAGYCSSGPFRVGPFNADEDDVYSVNKFDETGTIPEFEPSDINSKIKGLNAYRFDAFPGYSGSIDIEIEANPNIINLLNMHIHVYATIQLQPRSHPNPKVPVKPVCTNFNLFIPGLNPLNVPAMIAAEVLKPMIKDEIGKGVAGEMNIYYDQMIKDYEQKMEEDWEANHEGYDMEFHIPPNARIGTHSISTTADGMRMRGFSCISLTDLGNACVTTQTPKGKRAKRDMDGLRKMRKFYLEGTPDGGKYLELFKKHHDEVRKIIFSNGVLLTKFDAAINESLKCLNPDHPEKGFLSRETVTKVQQGIDAILLQASPSLKEDLLKVKEEIGNFSGLKAKAIKNRLAK